MDLSKTTIEALLDRLDMLVPENFGEDWEDGWPECKRQIEAVIANPTVEALKDAPSARDELANMLGMDWTRTEDGKRFTAVGQRIEADLLRCDGEKWHESDYCSGPRRTCIVDGVRYYSLR